MHPVSLQGCCNSSDSPSREVKIAPYAICALCNLRPMQFALCAILRDLRAPKRILFAFCVHSRNSSAPCLNCYKMLCFESFHLYSPGSGATVNGKMKNLCLHLHTHEDKERIPQPCCTTVGGFFFLFTAAKHPPGCLLPLSFLFNHLQIRQQTRPAGIGLFP